MRSCVKKEKGGKEAAAARCHRPPKHFHFLSDPMLSRVTEQDDCIRRCRGPPIVRPPPFRLRALGVQQAETSLAEAWRGGTRACIGPAGPTALVLALARDEPEPRGPGGQHGPRAVPPPSRTNWTRLVPLPVLIGRVPAHVARVLYHGEPCGDTLLLWWCVSTPAPPPAPRHPSP